MGMVYLYQIIGIEIINRTVEAINNHNNPPERASVISTTPSRENCFLRKYCFSFLQVPPNVCDRETPPFLFTFVFSLPSNEDRRQLIRSTWGSNTIFKEKQLRVVFIVGKETDSDPSDTLQAEAISHNDIIIINVSESFRNLTLKAIYGLHIANYYCPNAGFVMKTDDDMLVNMFSLLQHIDNLDRINTLMCHVWQKSAVFRGGRYGVSKAAFDKSFYPPFCSGSGYVMTSDVATVLLELALSETQSDVVHLDDPYVTGILASKTRVKYVAANLKYLLDHNAFSSLKDEHVMSHLFWHLHDKHQRFWKSKRVFHHKLWQRIMKMR